MRDNVTRIRELLRAVEPEDETTEDRSRRAFERYASNDERAFYVDPAPRAVTVREILRIALAHNWHREVQSALDRAGAMSLTSLDDTDLDALLSRMRQLEDCVRHGLDSPDAPPAR